MASDGVEAAKKRYSPSSSTAAGGRPRTTKDLVEERLFALRTRPANGDLV
jgi:hypothetical protein